MEKTIKLKDRAGSDAFVKLDNNLGWAIVYNDQFGHDILPDLMPLMVSAVDIVSGIIEATGKTKDIEYNDLLAVLNGDSVLEAAIHLSGLKLTDFINILWSMAKWANDSIEEPTRWIRNYEFTLDEVAPEVFALLLKCVVSSKNLLRLRSAIEKLKPKETNEATQPLTSIQLSSPDSSEA